MTASSSSVPKRFPTIKAKEKLFFEWRVASLEKAGCSLPLTLPMTKLEKRFVSQVRDRKQVRTVTNIFGAAMVSSSPPGRVVPADSSKEWLGDTNHPPS